MSLFDHPDIRQRIDELGPARFHDLVGRTISAYHSAVANELRTAVAVIDIGGLSIADPAVRSGACWADSPEAVDLTLAVEANPSLPLSARALLFRRWLEAADAWSLRVVEPTATSLLPIALLRRDDGRVLRLQGPRSWQEAAILEREELRSPVAEFADEADWRDALRTVRERSRPPSPAEFMHWRAVIAESEAATAHDEALFA